MEIRRDDDREQRTSTGGRLVVYVAAVLLGSSAGSRFTHRASSSWVDADPVTASLAGIYSLGAAVVIVALAPLPRTWVAVVAVLLASAMVAMWWSFAASESSTASFVFFSGWVFGVPAAAVVTAAARHFTSRN